MLNLPTKGLLKEDISSNDSIPWKNRWAPATVKISKK
jgi:hypothetical protein